MIDFIRAAYPAANMALVVALDVALKATAILMLAFAAHAALSRRRALVRSALWNATLVGLMLLPLASLAFPRLQIAILPARETMTVAASAPGSGGSLPEIQPDADESSVTMTPVPVAPASSLRSPEFVQSLTARPAPGQLASVVLGFYVTVALFLALRVAGSLVAVRRLKRQCQPVGDPAWMNAMRQTRDRLGITRPVALMRSDDVSVPMVVGRLRPAIILPSALPAVAGPLLIEMVLLHELAHVIRGDFGWNLVHKLVRLVYWPHPLVWPLGRIVGSVREQACDDLCVHVLGGSAAYRASLIEVASGLVSRRDPTVGMALARGTNLGRRLAWIDRSEGSYRCLLGMPARLALGATVVAFAAALGSIEVDRSSATASEPRIERPAQPVEHTNPSDAPKNETQTPQPDAIEIVVMAKDSGKPLAGATVRAAIDFEKPIHKSDNDGRVRIDLRAREFQESLSLDIWAEGYVQQRHFFAQNDARYPKVPPRYTVELLPGEETLGGKVIDAKGRPISGVKVVLWGYLGEKKDEREGAWMVDAVTDQKGQWRCRSFRSMKFAYLYLSHPNYLCDDRQHPRRHGRSNPDVPPQPGDQPLAGLRDFSDVQIMTVGVPLAGTVADLQGNSVAGALVGWIEADASNIAASSMPTTTTDADGRFRFPHVRPGRLVVLVKAKGHAPGLKGVEAKEGSGAVAVRLGPPHTVAGRVVDSAGKPIPDALVNIAVWRDSQALGEYLKTDADGRFRWQDAPPDPVLVHASRAGYAMGTSQRVAPDGPEVPLTLKHSLSISGHVKDSVSLTKTDKPERVVVPGVVISGIVRRLGGAPLEAAQVTLTYPLGAHPGRERFVRIKNGKLAPIQPMTTATTDVQGRFSLTREPDPGGRSFAIVVIHSDFYAEVDRTAFEANPTITARHWGRIEGVARVRGEPAPGASICYFGDRIHDPDVPDIFDSGEAKADDRGRFVLDRVVPGDVRVTQGFGEGTNFTAWPTSSLIEVRPGETARAEFRELGRPVIAKIVPPAAFDSMADYTVFSQCSIESTRPRIPYPRGELSKSGELKTTWAKRWFFSAEGREYRRKAYVGQAKLQSDGTIRAENLTPGDYRLRLTYSADPLIGLGAKPERIAFATTKFTIPEIPGGRSDEPFDLGVIRPEPE